MVTTGEEGRNGGRHIKGEFRFRINGCPGREFLQLPWKTLFLESRGVITDSLGRG